MCMCVAKVTVCVCCKQDPLLCQRHTDTDTKEKNTGKTYEDTHADTHTHTYTNTNTLAHTHMCTYVSQCIN